MEQTSKSQLAKARQIVAEACARPPQERAAYVASVCSNDEDLLDLVNLLLAAGASGDSEIEEASGLEPTQIDPFVPEIDLPSESIGPYRLQEKLGEGGFGIVYAAEQTEPVKRRVALKVLKPGMDTRAVLTRFEAERQVLALFDHPNIARVLDAGATDSGLPYFVMDLVKGEPIDAYCDRHRLSTGQRLKLFVAVCLAAQHAHSKGIVHRDLKPSNILVTLVDGEPTVKVIDFGIAKAAAGSLSGLSLYTEQGVMIGTPSYMSPEQAEMTGLEIDERSDIYSLGVVLYKLLSGALPFDPETLREKGYAELLRVLREVDPPKPSDQLQSSGSRSTETARRRRTQPSLLRRELKGELDWIVVRAMDKDRTRRYATAAEFARDVERYLSSEPVLARPPSVLYRTKKFVARNRAILGTATITLALALVVWRFFLVTPPSGNDTNTSIPPHSVAVLPFEDAGLTDAESYLSEGLSDELRDQLGRSGIRTAARSSSILAHELGLDALSVAARLRVANVVEGTIRRQGNVLRVYVELIEGSSGLAVWNQTFERGKSELLYLQQSIAEELAGLVRPDSDRAIAAPAARDVNANELMLLARHYEQQVRDRQIRDDPILLEAIQLYREATTADPESALAHSRLAGALVYLGELDAAEAPIFRALSLNPNLSEVRNTLGQYYWAKGSLDKAASEYARAVELNPNDADALLNYAFQLRLAWDDPRTAELPDLAALYERAVELDPLTLSKHAALGEFLGHEGRIDETRKVIDDVQQLFDNTESYFLLGWLKELTGEYEEAIAWTIRARDSEPDNADFDSRLAELYAKIGDFDTALELEAEPGPGLLLYTRRYAELIDVAEILMIERPGDLDTRWILAFAYQATGQFDNAIRILVAAGFPNILLENTARSMSEFEGHMTLINAMSGSSSAEAAELAQTLALGAVEEFWHGEPGWTELQRGCMLAILGRKAESLRALRAAAASARMPRDSVLRDSHCFQSIAQDEAYQATLRILEERRALIRKRLPATLAEFGVAL